MTLLAPIRARNDPRAGIAFILLAVFTMSLNDMLIKRLSGGYPLHEIVFARSAVAICFSLALVRLEGGWRILRTDRPWLHALRCLLVVCTNMTFFAALAVLPLAYASALFYVMPLFITLLSVPLLGEHIGRWRIGAVLLGFGGVLLMLGPAAIEGGVPGWTLLLPVLAAFFYALVQILTRRLGVSAMASAMSAYTQSAYIAIGLGLFAIAGDGRFARGVDSASVQFLLRAWAWPDIGDLLLMIGLGTVSAAASYSLCQAYRLAEAATVAPFEYLLLPLAIIWGWAIWGDLPGLWVTAGIALIAAAGLIVLARERRESRHRAPPRRW